MSPTNPTHSRTGSSPAMMTSPAAIPTQQQSNKAARTHTYPKLPDKFKVRNEQQQQPPTDEEVIYFWRLSGKTINFFCSLVNAKM